MCSYRCQWTQESWPQMLISRVTHKPRLLTCLSKVLKTGGGFTGVPCLVRSGYNGILRRAHAYTVLFITL